MKTTAMLACAGGIFASAVAFTQDNESTDCETLECRVTRLENKVEKLQQNSRDTVAPQQHREQETGSYLYNNHTDYGNPDLVW